MHNNKRMKKSILVSIGFFGFAAFSFAQQTIPVAQKGEITSERRMNPEIKEEKSSVVTSEKMQNPNTGSQQEEKTNQGIITSARTKNPEE